MKIVDIKTKIIPSNPRSKNYPIGYSGGIASNSNGVTPDLSIYLLKEIWERNIEERTDESGNEYLYIRKPLAIGGGATMYASDGTSVPSIFDGLPLDNQTIWKNPTTGKIEVIGGSGSSFDENAMWSALSGSSDNQINKSHLTNALAGYATESWVTGKGYATESWVASKNYATTEALNAVSNKLNDFLEGSDTDNIINKWKELEAFLSGMAETDNLAEILKTKADRSYVDSTFVTLATKQTITGEKTFSSVLNTAAIKASGAITAPSLAVSDWVTIAGIKLRKLEDGALMLEGNLALTGALTMYASNGQSFDTIYDGLPIDNDTIYWQEVDGSRVLKAREGSGSSFDKSAMWAALEGETTEQINKTHLTTALNGYATESWVTSKNYLTSVSIATISDLHANWDALLKAAPSAYVTRWPTISEVTDRKNLIIKLNGGSTEGTNLFTYNVTGEKTINITPAGIGAAASSHNHSWSNITSGKPTTLAGYGITDAPTKTGSGASGTWGINISGNASNADKLDNYHESDFFRINRGTVNSTEDSSLYRLNGTIVDTSTTGWSGMYAGFCSSGSMSALVFRVLGGGQGMNKIYMNYSVDGSRWGDAWRIIATTDSNVNSATQLLNKRNIWGQPFNGTADITGDMSNINDINMSGTLRIYGTNPLFYPSFGGGWYMLDTSWIRVYGNKSIYTEGMVEANDGFMAYASYSDTNSASHKLDYNNCAFKNTVDAYVNHNSSRSILGWRDTVSGYGYSTRYVIGSERPYNGNWGRMYLAVGNNDTGTSIGCSIEIWGNGQATVNGNLLVTGGVTLYGSDMRYKSIMQQVNLSLLDIAKAPSFIYRWNKHGMNQNRLNLGGSAQYTQTILPWAVEDNDNFLSMDYATVAYTFAVHTARHLLTYETRTDKKIKKLEREIVILKKQLKKLGYEEVRTLDDQSV